MGVAVYNVSATSARVSWPASPGCLDTFYSVMYDPNWNSLLMGYERKSFLHEERIPVSQTSMHLAHLLPQTAYFLCVTCQAANPVRDQCQVFSTPSDSSEGHDRAGWELAAGAWLTCCVLLLVIACTLLWGCRRTAGSAPGGSPSPPPPPEPRRELGRNVMRPYGADTLWLASRNMASMLSRVRNLLSSLCVMRLMSRSPSSSFGHTHTHTHTLTHTSTPQQTRP
uniref:Fibronectin type-III domain-containing protein n=1 Tax=Cyclopterus lumpus TaxID=8103 RepID=A0A8C2YX67_CYCLU